MEDTLLIIKPNVVEEHKIGAVISSLEDKGLIIRRMRMVTLSHERAEEFYAVHREKPFYTRLVNFMTSGPIVAMILEHEHGIDYVREVIGNTDPNLAAEGTIRRRFGRNVTENAVHASDSHEHAEHEIAFFFGPDDTIPPIEEK